MNTKEELIDISYWVATNMFGKHAFEPHPINNALCEVCNLECRNEIHIWPHYARDPAAAMLVLEKCISSVGWSRIISFGSTADGSYFINHCDSEPESEAFFGPEADTLPLAICLFARKLFEKKEAV